MGQTVNDVLKIQQVVNMREKTEQFLILSDNTARSKISTCPIHVSKNQPCRFFRWAFSADFAGKSAVKLRKTENFNLFLRCMKNWAKQRKEEKQVEKSSKSA